MSPISLVYMKAANKLANGSDRYVEIQPGYMSFHFELQSALIKFIKYAPSRKPELLTSDDQLCSDVSKGNRGAKVMTHEEHAKCVGAIITNLQSLETVIRIFLAAVNKQSWGMPKAGELEVDENYLTNFRAFGPLIDRYNDALTAEERAKYAVDPEHVRIRDAFAHGRLLSTGDVFPATLYKFGPARNGKVPVEFCEVLTKDWMDKTRAALREDHRHVAQCFNSRNFNSARMDLP